MKILTWLLLFLVAAPLAAQTTRTDTTLRVIPRPADTVRTIVVTTFRDSVRWRDSVRPPVDTVKPPTPPDTVRPPTGAGAPVPLAGSTILAREDFNATNWASKYAKRGNVGTGIGRTGTGASFTYSTPATSDNLIDVTFPETKDIYLSFWFNFAPGTDPTQNNRDQNGVKFVMLHRASGGRYTNGVGNLWLCSLRERADFETCNSGLDFSVHDNSSGDWRLGARPPIQPNPFFQNLTKTPNFKTVADGRWHKYTLHTVAGAAGYEELWIDDVKILSTQGKGYTHAEGGFRQLSFPGNIVAQSACCNPAFTLRYDDLVVWRN